MRHLTLLGSDSKAPPSKPGREGKPVPRNEASPPSGGYAILPAPGPGRERRARLSGAARRRAKAATSAERRRWRRSRGVGPLRSCALVSNTWVASESHSGLCGGGAIGASSGWLEEVRVAARQWAWEEAYRSFAGLDEAQLVPAELESFADAAWRTSHLDESIALRQRAYAAFLEAGDHRRSAYAAWRPYFVYLWPKGNASVASGWVGRAERDLANEPDCPTA